MIEEKLLSFDFDIELDDVGEKEQKLSHKNFNIFVQQVFDHIKKIWIRIAKIYDVVKNRTIIIKYKKNSYCKNGIELIKIDRFNYCV